MARPLEVVPEMPDSKSSADSPIQTHRRISSSSMTKQKPSKKTDQVGKQIWFMAQAHRDLERKSLMLQSRIKELHIGNYIDKRWKEMNIDVPEEPKEKPKHKVNKSQGDPKSSYAKAVSSYATNKNSSKKLNKSEIKKGKENDIKVMQDRALKNAANSFFKEKNSNIIENSQGNSDFYKENSENVKSKKEMLLEKYEGLNYKASEKSVKKRSKSVSSVPF
ncbi:unnamed protein product [Blepharisma stoltei]|uniref:Uncharacterized protein n=1 Tax=Blepharisma stoltei TaxID=1481888 RepID=A0AAU9JB67_9CILI|nr:unnamed protein product [Blepharisma stoltei]